MILAVLTTQSFNPVLTGYKREDYKGYKIHSVNLNNNFRYFISKGNNIVWGDYPYFDEYPTYSSKGYGKIEHKTHTDVIQSAKYIIDNNKWELTTLVDKVWLFKNIEDAKNNKPIIW